MEESAHLIVDEIPIILAHHRIAQYYMRTRIVDRPWHAPKRAKRARVDKFLRQNGNDQKPSLGSHLHALLHPSILQSRQPALLRPSILPSSLLSILPSRLPVLLQPLPSHLPALLHLSKLPSQLSALLHPSILPSRLHLHPSILHSRLPALLYPSILPSSLLFDTAFSPARAPATSAISTARAPAPWYCPLACPRSCTLRYCNLASPLFVCADDSCTCISISVMLSN